MVTATNHKTLQFHGKKPIHPATMQLLPNHFMAHVEKLSFVKSTEIKEKAAGD